MLVLVKALLRMLGALRRALELFLRASRLKKAFRRRFAHKNHHKKESAITMKKSWLIAAVAALAAVAGALIAVAVYLRRREKELDEYERLLFGEDEAAPADEAEAPAEQAADAGDAPADAEAPAAE